MRFVRTKACNRWRLSFSLILSSQRYEPNWNYFMGWAIRGSSSPKHPIGAEASFCEINRSEREGDYSRSSSTGVKNECLRGILARRPVCSWRSLVWMCVLQNSPAQHLRHLSRRKTTSNKESLYTEAKWNIQVWAVVRPFLSLSFRRAGHTESACYKVGTSVAR